MSKKREPLIGFMVVEDYTEDMSDWSGQITFPDPTGANLYWEKPIKMIEYSAFEKMQEAQFVPGLFKCVKCNVAVNCQNLYIQGVMAGQTGPNNDPQTCPNECGPMWKVTWREKAEMLMKTMEGWQAMDFKDKPKRGPDGGFGWLGASGNAGNPDGTPGSPNSGNG